LRMVLIARALTGKPEVLALDEACDGLDSSARAGLLRTLEGIAGSGTQLLFATHRSEEMLSCITHMLLLENGRIVQAIESGRGLPQSKSFARSEHSPALQRPGVRQPSAAFKSDKSNGAAKIVLRIQQASVFLERKKVLHEIDWEIHDDQHWAIFGRNGSGKSTLLKLAFGDVYAAWGGKVSRFEFTAKNTVWDLKRRVGYVAPELQANYREPISGRDVIASGFLATFGLRDRLTPAQEQRVADLVADFGVHGLAEKKALQMSYGEFRKMLLLRALVHAPELLICDEPFDGLDPGAKAEFATVLDRIAAEGTRLVVVTHHVGDIPDCITHGLLLENGRIIVQGRLETVRADPSIQRLFGGYESN
jgi:molybdate transport system ATP-binding protein